VEGRRNMSYIVAIDGPAGSGKGTITKLVAKDLGLVSIDTGMLYRCHALAVLQNNIDISDDEIEKCVVRKGDVLFNRTNSIELVGKTAVFDLPEDMVIAGYIIRVRLNEKLLPEIFSQYMNLEAIKSILRGMAKGAVNQANINAQELQSIKVYIPSMELQNQFVEMKEQVDKSKFINQLL